MSKKILFVCGSLNQTTMMHRIAESLEEYECYFTPYYADGLLGWMARRGWLDFSILGGRHRRNTERYLADHNLAVDFGGRARDYDLAYTCTDMLVQKNLRRQPLILIQEGLMERKSPGYYLARYLKMPRFLADTAATGLSDAYDLFCVASPGFRDLFIERGVRAEKIVITGIPNFDNVRSYLQNDFPYRNFVLAATSSRRETFKYDNRHAFIRRAVEIAAGRRLIFKLHPNEDFRRARAEVRRLAPEALILIDGNIHHMIANCDVLVAQYSSVVFTGLALGKEVHTNVAPEELRSLLPIQNGGASAWKIAEIGRHLLENPMEEPAAVARWARRLGWQPTDAG